MRAKIVVKAANFDWEDEPLVETIAALTGLPTALENDGNTALLAEVWVGVGRGGKARAVRCLRHRPLW